MKIVLQKYIADSGFCSRRKAEELIRSGVVRVNNEIATLGARVDGSDEVEISGESIGQRPENIYIKLNKPVGYTCTNKGFKDERNIFELIDLASCFSLEQRNDIRLHVVGRLDKDSRGLVLVTNDGELTQVMTHPSFEHEKEYLVSITNYELRITEDLLKDMSYKFIDGIELSSSESLGQVEVARAKRVEYLGEGRFKIVLGEGKKRQIRRMFGVFDLAVEDLVRVKIGKVALGDLEEGKWERLDKKDIL